MKNVLIVYYSQSGQTGEVVDALARPLEVGNFNVWREALRPYPDFPFPWRFSAFLDAFPETVRLEPRPIQPLGLPPEASFDLVILVWSVWYLSPSQPVTAFLQSAQGKRLLAGRPVVSVVACRNMWFSAFDTVKALVAEAGGQLVDHVALADESHALATFITTPRWMLTGRRGGFLGLLPAGVSARQIVGLARFGKALAEALERGGEKSGQPMLGGLGAVKVVPHLVLSERVGKRILRVWSKIARHCGQPGQWQRMPILLLFAGYLTLAVLTIVPLNIALQRLFAPFFARRTAAAVRHYEQPSGADETHTASYE